MGERTFPIMPYERRKEGRPHPMRIPWSVAELAYSVYAKRYGEDQSLGQLAERGGFGACEMDEFLPDWCARSDALSQARARIEALEEERDGIQIRLTEGVVRGQLAEEALEKVEWDLALLMDNEREDALSDTALRGEVEELKAAGNGEVSRG